MNYKIVCGADTNWPVAFVCEVYNDIRCCICCPHQKEGCHKQCGVHGNKAWTGTGDPREYCEFLAVILEKEEEK